MIRFLTRRLGKLAKLWGKLRWFRGIEVWIVWKLLLTCFTSNVGNQKIVFLDNLGGCVFVCWVVGYGVGIEVVYRFYLCFGIFFLWCGLLLVASVPTKGLGGFLLVCFVVSLYVYVSRGFSHVFVSSFSPWENLSFYF